MDTGGFALIVIASLLLVNLVVLGMRSSLNQRGIEQRLERLERRLDRIAEHLGLDANLPPDVKSFRELIRAGNKIEAIKEYREQHHVGLKEAKGAIDAVEREM